jgi:regulator of sigma E protease
VGYFEIIGIISPSIGKPLELEIERNTAVINLTVTPLEEVQDGVKKGVIGVGMTPYSPAVKVRYGLWDAAVKSKNDMVNLTFFIFNAFRKMIAGKISAQQLSGPIEIAKFSQKAMEKGPSNLFMLIAFISLQLGLVNLFPIPALDGGHLMIYSIEAIIRKDFSPKVKTVLLNTGFFLLISLMAFVILNDVAKLLPRGWASFWPF